MILAFETYEPFCPDKADGEIRLKVTGGLPGNDYIYKWSNNSQEKNLLNISEGFYKVVVSDLNGCVQLKIPYSLIHKMKPAWSFRMPYHQTAT